MNKARIWQCIILVTVVALILGVAPQSGTAQRIASPKIEWGKDISIETAKGLTSHRLINKPVERGEFFSFSNKVLKRITGKNIKIKEEHTGWSGDFHAWIDKGDPSSLMMQNAVNGNFSFSNRMTEFATMERVSLPGKEEAQEIALGFLKDLELLPSDFEKNGILLHVGGLFAQDFKDGNASKISQKLITLNYGRELNGIPIQGPGSKLIVQIGHQGEIVTLNKKWNPIMLKLEVLKPFKPKLHLIDPGIIEIKPGGQTTPWAPAFTMPLGAPEKTKQAPHFTSDEVRNMINRTMPTIWTTVDRIVINDIKLVYYDRSGNFIQPAYAVEMTIFTGEESFQYLRHFSALRNAPEPIYLAVYTERPKVFDEKQKPAEFKEELD